MNNCVSITDLARPIEERIWSGCLTTHLLNRAVTSTGPVIRMMVSSISWPEQLYIRHICCL